MCVCVLCRAGQNFSAGLPVAGTIFVYSQQPVLQDDHDTQQQMYALPGNPAYNIVPEHSQQPLQQDDWAYSNNDISQQEAVVPSGSTKHGAALKAAACAK